MTDALCTDDLDLSAVRVRGEILAIMRPIRIRADDPSMRTVEAKTRHGTAPVSNTVVSQMLRDARFPALRATRHIVGMCFHNEQRSSIYESLRPSEEDALRRHVDCRESAPI
jgi:hypothetical protein